ncbi:hypothetical protein OPV22_015603 [Ensete ventricosum]|uniref:Uncharacterized protein n=1 Tax=Ensete ventricosum TaxID=4639 RepID=A0AAV8R0I2_ENSVE|nr:hypothetical protein OPV22_015603 [Ensete ventricosum]
MKCSQLRLFLLEIYHAADGNLLARTRLWPIQFKYAGEAAPLLPNDISTFWCSATSGSSYSRFVEEP